MLSYRTQCAVVAALTAGVAHAAPVITNGSFTGPVGLDTAAPGWTRAQSSPDIVNVNGPFNNSGVAWTLSPDGGTWTRGNGVGDSRSEAVSQDVAGFDIGVEYAFDFWQTNTGFTGNPQSPLSGAPGHWEVYVDGNLIGQSADIDRPGATNQPNVWSPASVSFFATDTDHVVTFLAENSTGTTQQQIAYMGLDGVRVREVPAPAGVAVLGALGLAAGRRRRGG